MTRRRLLVTGAVWLAGVAAVLVPVALEAEGRHETLSLTMPSVVTVLAVDLRGGELRPMSFGSGTIVDPGGAILTNHHVLYDARDQRLYDLFLIGRYRGPEREPDLVCAGVPARGELRPTLDLALIRCDTNLDGQPWTPAHWPSVPLGDSQGIVPGEQVWVLGYPLAGGGAIRVSAGLISGWTGEHGGATGRAFMRTDAAISAGNSGGTAVNRQGRFIGVPTAFRVVTAEGGQTITAIGKIGLIRPIEHARDLLLLARGGSPEGGGAGASGGASGSVSGGAGTPAGPSVGTTPIPAAHEGIVVTTRVIDAVSHEPLPGALVVALAPGTDPSQVDPRHLEDAAVAWGLSDALGQVALEPPLPAGARYSVAVSAAGFQPMVQRDALGVADEGGHHQVEWTQLALVRSDPF